MLAKYFLLIFTVFFLSSCGIPPKPESSACIGCMEEYPYYNARHLQSRALTIEHAQFPEHKHVEFYNLKKVFVFPVESRRQTIVGFANDFLTALENEGWKVLDSDTQIQNENPLIDIERATGIKDPDIVAFYMTEYSPKSYYFYRKWSLLPKMKFLKVSILEDFNYRFQIDNAGYFSQHADVLLVRYPEAYDQVISERKVPVYHFPHSAGSSYLEAQSEFKNKKPKLLLSGAISKEWYPLRYKAQELFNAHNNAINFRKHPGYQPGIDPILEANRYASAISEDQLALTGAGMGTNLPAPYILAKHFEIPATGTVVVTDKFVAPLMERLGFIEGVHYLATTPNDLETDIARWLQPENLENLEKIGFAGQQLVSERHTLQKRVGEFNKVVAHTWAKKTRE